MFLYFLSHFRHFRYKNGDNYVLSLSQLYCCFFAIKCGSYIPDMHDVQGFGHEH